MSTPQSSKTTQNTETLPKCLSEKMCFQMLYATESRVRIERYQLFHNFVAKVRNPP